jgi:hypothetical protein
MSETIFSLMKAVFEASTKDFVCRHRVHVTGLLDSQDAGFNLVCTYLLQTHGPLFPCRSTRRRSGSG